MGNQSSLISSSGGGSDVTKLYTIDTDILDAGETYGGFTLIRGKRKRDNASVLIFRCEKQKSTSAGLSGNALRQAKKLRHPLVLNLLDGVETDNDIFMVTEDATPLALCLSQVDSDAQRQWGLRCVTSALAFLNEKCKLVHGNISPWSIFATPGGDWKIFGLELLDMDYISSDSGTSGVVLPPLLRQAQWIPYSQYKSPERRRNDFKLMEGATSWAMDTWALGCVILDVYEKKVPTNSTQARSDPQSDADRLLPPNLRQAAKQLLNPDPRVRLAPSAFLRSDYFSDIFVRSMVFLEELQLKAVEKKEAFFKSLTNSASSFPQGSLQYKVIPMIAQAISFESRAVNAANMAAASGQPPPSPASVNVLLNMLDAILACEQTLRSANTGRDLKSLASCLDTTMVDMFGCNDRIVRVGLLQRIEKIATCVSGEAVNGCFDQICTGFSDATPIVRELTIKAMIPLVPRLNDANKNDKLVRYLAKLQTDAEHAIRTNCVVCLGLIAPHLSADARRKTLTASFARAMKDPFVHARAAGLRGLINSHRLMGLDSETLATKILPTVCPLLVDPAKDVRQLANEAMNALMKTLQEDLKALELNSAANNSTSANGGSGDKQGSSEGFLGMAVNFASSLATSKPSASNASNAVPKGNTPNPAAAAPRQAVQLNASNTTTTNWDDEETTTSKDFLGQVEDPDDFFTSQGKEKAQKAPISSNQPVVDIFANEDRSKLKPMRISKRNSSGSKVPKDLLSDDDLDLFAQPFPKPMATSGPKITKPTTSVPQNPLPTKSVSSAEDDFFSALLTQPPKKKG